MKCKANKKNCNYTIKRQPMEQYAPYPIETTSTSKANNLENDLRFEKRQEERKWQGTSVSIESIYKAIKNYCRW